MLLNCKDANHVCDKSQYKEATLWEKIKLTVHLIYCRACREYTKNNSKLTEIISKGKVEVMDNAAKENIKSAFDKELAKHK